jgi:hydroxymethylpyrimidine pyrophosphatase-like HAD family hydrolase
VADVGKAAAVAGAHQAVKAVAQSRTPEVNGSDVQNAIKRPPPPPPDDELR